MARTEGVAAVVPSIDYEANVLTGILPARKDLLLYALQHLEPAHFRSEVNRNLFVLLERYYDVTSGILPRQTLSDMLTRSETVDQGKAMLYEEIFSGLESRHLEDHEFRYAVDALKDLRAQQMTGEAITTAFEILERGAEVGRDLLKGHKEARTFAYQQFAEIDKLDNIETAPEGDMRHESKEILEEYEARKAGKIGKGVLTGIETYDGWTGGFQRGEMCLVSGKPALAAATRGCVRGRRSGCDDAFASLANRVAGSSRKRRTAVVGAVRARKFLRTLAQSGCCDAQSALASRPPAAP
jgi:replicative DNA helicase